MTGMRPLRVLVCEPTEAKAEKLRQALIDNSLLDHTEVSDSMARARATIETSRVDVVFLSFPSFGLSESCSFVFSIRSQFPAVCFALYVDVSNFWRDAASLTGESRRLLHYYKLDWNLEDLTFADAVHRTLESCMMDLGIVTRE